MKFLISAALFLAGCGAVVHPTAHAPYGPAIFIGDSITQGWNLPAAFNDVTVVNQGVSGQTSIDMLARFANDVLDQRPSIVHILAGTNDLWHAVDTDTGSVAKMASEAAAQGACVIVATIPPNENPTAPAGIDAQIDTWNESLVRLARTYGYKLADYHAALVNADGSENSALFLDGAHPNADGYVAMYKVTQPLLDQCYQERG